MTPPPPKKVKNNVKSRSIVWKFFKGKIDPTMEHVDCPSCGKRLKYLGTTSGLKSHIENMHGKEIEEIIENERTASPDEKSIEEANRELAKSFATGLVPFRFAENPEFRQFLQKIPDDYMAPNAIKMKSLINELASNHASKVKKQLESIGKYTLLSDGYTDRRKDFQFYSVHISYIDPNFKRKITFLALRAVKKSLFRFRSSKKRNRAKLETLNSLLTVSELSKIKRQDRSEFWDDENGSEQTDDEFSDSGDESDDDDVVSNGNKRRESDDDVNDSDKEIEEDDNSSEHS